MRRRLTPPLLTARGFLRHVPSDSHFARPETVESLFIAWRLTGDPQYREWGWGIFEAIEKHCRIESGGYASVLNVDALPVELEDKMETFLMVRVLRPHSLPGSLTDVWAR